MLTEHLSDGDQVLTIFSSIFFFVSLFRFEQPEQYSLFIPEDGEEMAVSGQKSLSKSSVMQLSDDSSKSILRVPAGGVLVQNCNAEHKSSKSRGKKQILYEEDGVMGLYLDNDAELRQYPDLENLTIDLRKRPRFLHLTFQSGMWKADVQYNPEMRLSALLAVALQVCEEDDEGTLRRCPDYFSVSVNSEGSFQS